MKAIAKVTQHLRQVLNVGRLHRQDGLINTTDLLVATAATVVLAAGVGGAVLSTLDEASYGKAQPDAQAFAQAIMTFYKDTGKWPGQAEHAGLATGTTAKPGVLLATGTYDAGEGTSTYNLPDVANSGLKWEALSGATTCAPNSGQGFVNAAVTGFASSSSTTAIPTSGAGGITVYNINNYLVRQPSTSSYPNWQGPYIQDISDDPWGRSWVAYLAPLYCSETVTGTDAAGKLGYAWLLTGGANGTVTTNAQRSVLDADGDDAGVNLGKLSTQNSGAVVQ
jgi:hypothetical protein